MTSGRATGSQNLSGPQKGAVLCMLLGPERAGSVLQQLAPDEVERVSREIALLRSVGPEVVQSVLAEFHGAANDVQLAAHGGVEYAGKLLESALGPNRADQVLNQIQEKGAKGRLHRFERTPPEVLAGILRDENPQILALIMAHLDVAQAARVLEALGPELAADVLFRVARMDKVGPEMLGLLEHALKDKADLDVGEDATASGGPGAVAKLLNQMGGEIEKQLLESIESRNPETAAAVRSLMFVLEDLLKIDGKGIQRILREVETKELAMALKAASDELKAHIKANMSERAGSALDEEIELLGPVRVKEVKGAHARIVEAVRSLEESGDILIQREGGSDDFIT